MHVPLLLTNPLILSSNLPSIAFTAWIVPRGSRRSQSSARLTARPPDLHTAPVRVSLQTDRDARGGSTR